MKFQVRGDGDGPCMPIQGLGTLTIQELPAAVKEAIEPLLPSIAKEVRKLYNIDPKTLDIVLMIQDFTGDEMVERREPIIAKGGEQPCPKG